MEGEGNDDLLKGGQKGGAIPEDAHYFRLPNYPSESFMNEIDSNILFDNGLIDSSLQPVKILGDGDIAKAIKIKATKFSKSAILKIEKAGGKAELQ